jgi:hypothetical protein
MDVNERNSDSIYVKSIKNKIKIKALTFENVNVHNFTGNALTVQSVEGQKSET